MPDPESEVRLVHAHPSASATWDLIMLRHGPELVRHRAYVSSESLMSASMAGILDPSEPCFEMAIPLWYRARDPVHTQGRGHERDLGRVRGVDGERAAGCRQARAQHHAQPHDAVRARYPVSAQDRIRDPLLGSEHPRYPVRRVEHARAHLPPHLRLKHQKLVRLSARVQTHLLERHRGVDRGVDLVRRRVLGHDRVQGPDDVGGCGRGPDSAHGRLRLVDPVSEHGDEHPHLVPVEVAVVLEADLERDPYIINFFFRYLSRYLSIYFNLYSNIK